LSPLLFSREEDFDEDRHDSEDRDDEDRDDAELDEDPDFADDEDSLDDRERGPSRTMAPWSSSSAATLTTRPLTHNAAADRRSCHDDVVEGAPFLSAAPPRPWPPPAAGNKPAAQTVSPSTAQNGVRDMESLPRWPPVGVILPMPLGSSPCPWSTG